MIPKMTKADYLAAYLYEPTDEELAHANAHAGEALPIRWWGALLLLAILVSVPACLGLYRVLAILAIVAIPALLVYWFCRKSAHDAGQSARRTANDRAVFAA